MSKEGGTEAPTRHPIDFEHPDFLNPEKLDAEMRRVFDICHGCSKFIGCLMGASILPSLLIFKILGFNGGEEPTIN